MTQIQDKFKFSNGLETQNRIVLAPMTLSVCKDGGYVSEDDLSYYSRRSASIGMAITGSAYVHPLGQAFANSYSVAEDDKIEGLSRLAQAMKANGALAVLQIYHGGRMVPPYLVKEKPVAPSAVIAKHGIVEEPRPLSNSEVEDIIDLFLSAVERAIEAGFDGVELHGANTYLIQQFLSPHSNRRHDKWGGSKNNRMRFAKTLVKKIKQLVKDKCDRPFLIGYRFSPEEIEVPGIDLFTSLQLIEQLIKLGIDYLHMSVDDAWQTSLRDIESKEPIILKLLKQIKGRVPLIAVGKIKTKEEVNRLLDAGIPMVSLAQSLLLDPDWTQKVIDGREEDIIHLYRDDLQEELKLPKAFVENFRDYLEGKYN